MSGKGPSSCGAITAVKLFLASEAPTRSATSFATPRSRSTTVLKGDTDKKRVQNMDPWVIIPDEFVYQQILEIESPTGHSLARDGKRSYYTSDNLPMARLSSLIKYKIDKYVGPDSIKNDGSIYRLSKIMKDIKGALSGLHSDDKKTNPVPRLFKKALNRLSNEEKEEFDRFLAVDTFGPRALFPYSQKDGCNTDTFDQLMGTPSKPTRRTTCRAPSTTTPGQQRHSSQNGKAGLLRHPVRQKRQRKELGRGKQ